MKVNKMKLNALYTSILKFANHTVSKDGYVSRIDGDDINPATTRTSKRLVLPTDKYLADPNPEACIVFHPLSESTLKIGETEVMEYFRTAVNQNLNTVFLTMIYQMAVIATSDDLRKKLSPDQQEFLSTLKNVDGGILKILEKLMASMTPGQNQQTAINIYLKKNGVVNEKSYQRVGVVTFPLYAALTESIKEKGPVTVWGVKMLVKERDALIVLMDYMIPEIGTPKSHDRGSNAEVAPSLDALMKAALTVAGPLNGLIELFGNQIEDPGSLRFEDEWVPVFDNLACMLSEIRQVPMQSAGKIVPPPVVATVAQAPNPTPWNQPQQQQQFQPQGFGQPQQPPQGIVKTANGLDFTSVLRSVPGVVQPNMYPGQMQQNNQPRWATGGGIGQQQQFQQPGFGQPQQQWNQPQTFGQYNPRV